MAECRYKGWCRIEYDTDFDVCYPCVGDWGDTCAEYEPMPDVKALKGLADEMDEDARKLKAQMNTRPPYWVPNPEYYADRIRRALEVES